MVLLENPLILVITATVVSFFYYFALVVVLGVFYNPSFKKGFFGNNAKANAFAGVFFFVYLFFGMTYTFFIVGKGDIASLLTFAFATALVLTVIIQQVGKGLMHKSAVFYDAVVAFVAILIFISPSEQALRIGVEQGLLWSLGMVLALPILVVTIRHLGLHKLVKMVSGAE